MDESSRAWSPMGRVRLVERRSELEGLDVHGIPLPLVFFPLSRLRPKLAFQASQRNDRQQEHSLPNLRFGELGSEGSRMGESTVVLWQETKHFGSLVNV